MKTRELETLEVSELGSGWLIKRREKHRDAHRHPRFRIDGGNPACYLPSVLVTAVNAFVALGQPA